MQELQGRIAMNDTNPILIRHTDFLFFPPFFVLYTFF